MPRRLSAGMTGARRYKNGQSSVGKGRRPSVSTRAIPIRSQRSAGAPGLVGGFSPKPLIGSLSRGSRLNQKNEFSRNARRIDSRVREPGWPARMNVNFPPTDSPCGIEAA